MPPLPRRAKLRADVSVVIPCARDVSYVNFDDALSGVDFEVIVVANGYRPRGFTETVNQGFRAANGRYVIIMNNDVTPIDLVPLVEKVKEKDVVCAFPHTISGFMRSDLTGWCFAVDKSYFGTKDLLDNNFIHWYSDNKLLSSLQTAGLAPSYVPEATIEHEGLDIDASHLGRESREFEPIVKEWIEGDKELWEARSRGDSGFRGVRGAN